LELLVEYNFKKDYAVKCINANKHNHVTTSYYLLLKRYEQLGEVSEKDFEFYDDKKINALALEEKKLQIALAVPKEEERMATEEEDQNKAKNDF